MVMSLLDIHGHDQVLLQLQRQVRNDRVPHGLIFHGPQGIGKKSLARMWAKSLLCENPIEKPWQPQLNQTTGETLPESIIDSCGQCHQCQMFESASHPDLHMVDKSLIQYASQGRERQMISLPIDVIREFVIQPAGSKPTHGRARIFIIDGAHEMRFEAQNAFLKTLEEPPEKTFIILVTPQLDRLLTTVLSRCQKFRFNGLDKAFILEKMSQSGVDTNQQNYWADFCQGQLGWGLSLIQLDLYETKCNILSQLVDLRAESVLDFAKWLVDQAKDFGKNYVDQKLGASASSANRQGMSLFLAIMAHGLNQALRLLAHQGAQVELQFDQADVLDRLARKFGIYGCNEAIWAIHEAEKMLEANVNPTLLFEKLLLQCVECVRRSGEKGLTA